MFKRFAILAILALVLAAQPALAQKPQQPEQEPQKAAQTRQTQAQASQAADQAARLDAADADMAITYDQILEHPDDVELNYRYARAQIARGELKNAGATLERILLVNPNLARVRLLYAVVLLRLDSMVEAQRELETLQALPMPDSLREEIERYLALVKKSQKRNRINGSFSLGLENDDNRNSTPATTQMLFGNTPVKLVGDTSRRHDDASTLFMGSIGLLHDLGTQAGHTAFVNYSYYRAEQASVKTLNLQAHSVGLGGTYRAPLFNTTPSLLFDHIVLNQTTFLRQRGFSLHFDRQLNAKLALYMDFKNMLQIYSPTVDVPASMDRNGAQMDFLWGGDYLLNPKMKVGASVDYTVKHARRDFDSFQRAGLNLRHEWLLTRGMFLMSAVSYNHDSYDEPDFVVSSHYRTDDWWRASATVGAPLSLLHPALKDLMATLTYEYFHSLSSIDNYSYTNNKIVGLVSWRWDTAF